MFYVSLMVTTKQKPTVDTQKIKRRESKHTTIENHQFTKERRDFPGGTVVKNPPASAGDTGSSPGLGRSHMLRSN